LLECQAEAWRLGLSVTQTTTLDWKGARWERGDCEQKTSATIVTLASRGGLDCPSLGSHCLVLGLPPRSETVRRSQRWGVYPTFPVLSNRALFSCFRLHDVNRVRGAREIIQAVEVGNGWPSASKRIRFFARKIRLRHSSSLCVVLCPLASWPPLIRT